MTINKQPIPRRFFVTGTDTDAGKTLIASAMLACGQLRGLTTFGLKPVAAGCDQDAQGRLVNSDALLHQSLSNPPQDYSVHNPIALQAPIAPHIAAAQENKRIELEILAKQCLESLNQSNAQLQIVEGAGGWLVPLNNRHTLADLAVSLNQAKGQPPLEVVIVVGLRLGCINHAITTLETIQSRGLKIAGWVANSLSPDMTVESANLDYLTQRFNQDNIPCLGHVPFLADLATPMANGELAPRSETSTQACTIKLDAAKSASRYLKLPTQGEQPKRSEQIQSFQMTPKYA